MSKIIEEAIRRTSLFDGITIYFVEDGGTSYDEAIK